MTNIVLDKLAEPSTHLRMHDVGIVYSDEPFVVVIASNGTDVHEFEKIIRDVSYEFAMSK